MWWNHYNGIGGVESNMLWTVTVDCRLWVDVGVADVGVVVGGSGRCSKCGRCSVSCSLVGTVTGRCSSCGRWM